MSYHIYDVLEVGITIYESAGGGYLIESMSKLALWGVEWVLELQFWLWKRLWLGSEVLYSKIEVYLKCFFFFLLKVIYFQISNNFLFLLLLTYYLFLKKFY